MLHVEVARPRRHRARVGHGHQGAREGSHAGKAVLRLARQRLDHHCVELRGEPGHEPARRHERRVPHLLQQRVERLVLERRAPGDRLVEDRGERVLVRLGAGVLRPEGLLRRHVLQRADHRVVRRQRRGLGGLREHLRQAEVHDFRLRLAVAVTGEEHVGRLEVPVHHAAVVRERQRRGDGQDDRERLGHRQPLHLAEIRGAVLADEALHDEVRHVALDPDVQDADDVRVIEACRHPALAHEAGAHLLVRRQVLVKHLEGHALPQPRVSPLEDARGGPVPDQRADDVRPQPDALQQLAADRSRHRPIQSYGAAAPASTAEARCPADAPHEPAFFLRAVPPK